MFCEFSHYACEAFWHKRTRIRPENCSLMASEKFMDHETSREARLEKQAKEEALHIHEKPMQFPRVRYDESHLQMGHETRPVPKKHAPEEFKTTFKPVKYFGDLDAPESGGPYKPPLESKTTLVERKHKEKCLTPEPK